MEHKHLYRFPTAQPGDESAVGFCDCGVQSNGLAWSDQAKWKEHREMLDRQWREDYQLRRDKADEANQRFILQEQRVEHRHRWDLIVLGLVVILINVVSNLFAPLVSRLLK